MAHDPHDPGAPASSRGPHLALASEPSAESADAGAGATLTAGQERLVSMHLPKIMGWAQEVARRFCGRVDPHDLYTPGLLALQEAARTFEPGRTTTFPVYAKHHVRGRMIDVVRGELFSFEARVERSMERAYEVLTTHQIIEADLFHDEEAKLRASAQQAADEVAAMTYVAGLLEAHAEGVEDGLISAIDFRTALSRLPVVQQQAIVLISQQGMTLDEAARKAGVHSGTIRRRHASALKDLKVLLGEPGEPGEPEEPEDE